MIALLNQQISSRVVEARERLTPKTFVVPGRGRTLGKVTA